MMKHLARFAFLAAVCWLVSPPGAVSVASSSMDAGSSFRFEGARSPLVPKVAAPVALTASDGTGLDLVAFAAAGVLEGPLAFTELRLAFRNPRPEIIEGRFRVTLPPGAVLSRFAMKIGSGWQEGEVVERQRARRIYEDFLHRRQDPALLEQQAGNEFSARVFPIPAHAEKELIVSYSHALASSGEPYVIPLLGLPEIARLDVRVLLGTRPAGEAAASNLGGTASERRIVELHKTDWTPTQDFEVKQDAAAGRAGLRHGNLAVVRVAPQIKTPRQEIDGLYVLVDSSASRALGYASQVTLVEQLVAGLAGGAGEATPVGVAAFDQAVTPIYEGPAGGFGERHGRRLLDHRALGASDLHGALQWLGKRLREDDGRRFPRLLVVTDGVATAGDTGGGALGGAVSSLGEGGLERLDVLAVGGLRDEAVLRLLVTGRLDHDGQVLDGTMPLAEIARRLTRSTRSGIEVAVTGAKWVWPRVLDGVQPGDEALIYADLPAGKPLRVALAGRRLDLGAAPLAAERPLLERAWVKSRIDRLLHLRETDFADDDDVRRALASEVTQLSVDHRVLSPYTAFLVLETERDYQRYRLDRKSLADILTVGPGGLDVVNRTPPPSPFDGHARFMESSRKRDSTITFRGGSPRVEAAQPAPEPPAAPAPTFNARVEGANEQIAEMREEAEELERQLREIEEGLEVTARGRRQRAEAQGAPWSGRYSEVMRQLAEGRQREARQLADSSGRPRPSGRWRTAWRRNSSAADSAVTTASCARTSVWWPPPG